MGVDSFYVCALPSDQAYLVAAGKIKELDLAYGLPKGWLDRHSCIAVANHVVEKPLWIPPHLRDLLDKIPPEDSRLVFFPGILGTVEVLSCKRHQYDSGWYKYRLGRTMLLFDPFPLKWRSQLKELPSEVVAKFLQHTGYETW